MHKTCYICGEDLMQINRNDKNHQQDLNSMPQKFPEMKLWNGQSREVCSSCYKIAHEGLSIFKKNNSIG